MQPSLQSYLSFHSGPVLVAASILILLAAIALSYWNWERSHRRSGVFVLESLRLAIIGLIVLSLHQPEWTQEFRPSEKPKLVVLVDQSKSMETQDVLSVRSDTNAYLTRKEATQPLIAPSAWSDLDQRFDVVVEPFGDAKTPGATTNLGGVLDKTLDRYASVQSVVLISDGDWNQGPPPIEIATKYRQSKIPIFTVPIGTDFRLPDLEAVGLDLPTFGITGKSVRIPFTIESSLARDHVVQVAIEVSNGEKLFKEVRLRPKSKTTDSVVWTPKEAGEYSVKVIVPSVSEETLLTNNEIAAPISIRQERLKVLIVETYPRWEYRYLRNALSRDPGIEVACLLMHPKLEKTGGGNRDYIAEFPSKPEELSEYDVVFLGDVGVAEKQLTDEQCKMVRGLIEFQASGLVLMPGPYGYQQSLQESPLEPLIPVVVDAAKVDGVGVRSAMHFELTESGRRSLLTKLADSEEENLDVWSTLPGFQWYSSILRAKAGAETLAVHQENANEFGRLPLIVTKTFGAGKVLYMATDGAWRWRRGVEDKFHYRFWGQVVRWMAYQRNMAKGETIRFYYSPESPRVGNKLSLKANVMKDTGEPLSSGSVTAKVESPSGETIVVSLKSAGEDSWGLFQGEVDIVEPGTHRVLLGAPQSNSTLEAEFFVQGDSQERVGQPAKPKVLEEISKVSLGASFSIDKLSTLRELVAGVPDAPATIKRWQLWAHPWMMMAMIAMLTTFWIGRKWLGML